MKYQIMKKFAEANLEVSFLRGWKDTSGNIMAVFDISGKKYSLIKINNSNDWNYWMGIGSEEITVEMPAGRGDYLISDRVDPAISAVLSDIILSGVALESLTTAGASWSPKNSPELESLARLVDDSAKINNYLSNNGLLYTGSDRNIFGENISGSDILRYSIEAYRSTPTRSVPPSAERPKEEIKRPEKAPGSSTSIFGGVSPKWISNSKGHGYEIGPRHHSERPGRSKRFENWQSNNAWDILGDAGTTIYSLTNGTVKSVKQTSDSATNVFGISISVSGADGYPDIFYTHTDNPFVKSGDKVTVGSPIAQIGMPKTDSMPKHVHIGLPFGTHISSLISQGGEFK